MARIVKEQEYAARRNEILDVAQRLVEAKGYEQMTIRDIMDELHISKGALYHYFGSKQAVLEALTERMVGNAKQLVLPIVNDPKMPALEKLARLFATLVNWKATQSSLVLALLHVWYADENAVVREKVRIEFGAEVMPLLAAIVQQGCQEGVFSSAHPDQSGRMILALTQDLSDNLARSLLAWQSKENRPEKIERMVVATTEAIERLLAAPGGSIRLADPQALGEWFGTREKGAP